LAPSPAPRRAVAASTDAARLSAGGSERRAPPESEDDLEIEEILSDLPGPVDASLADATPDEVIRRLDALLDDLSTGSGGARVPSVDPNRFAARPSVAPSTAAASRL
jgi:hypothetical protein